MLVSELPMADSNSLSFLLNATPGCSLGARAARSAPIPESFEVLGEFVLSGAVLLARLVGCRNADRLVDRAEGGL